MKFGQLISFVLLPWIIVATLKCALPFSCLWYQFLISFYIISSLSLVSASLAMICRWEQKFHCFIFCTCLSACHPCCHHSSLSLACLLVVYCSFSLQPPCAISHGTDSFETLNVRFLLACLFAPFHLSILSFWYAPGLCTSSTVIIQA